MTRLHPLLPSRRALTALDLALGAWTALWVTLGLSVAHEVRGLSELSDTVSTIGSAVDEVGRTLGGVGSLPLVGDLIRPAERIQQAGRSALESGRSSRDSVRDLSLLLGLAIAVIPSVPVLGFYLPLRVARVREARALTRTVREADGDPALREFLAHRAVHSMPYRRLRRVTPVPWRDLADRRYEALAAAELDRLGVRPKRSRADRRR